MKNPSPVKTVLLVTCLVCFPVLGLWLGWVLRIEYDRGMSLRHDCRFDQIEFMLRCYHAEYGAFPPTRYQATPGGPFHSWRVLLVTRLNTIYSDVLPKYDFTQNWNSATNMEGLGKRPHLHYFRATDGESEIANILSIGEEDDWPTKHKPLRSRLVKQGKDRFLLVEYPDSSVHWMEPRY